MPLQAYGNYRLYSRRKDGFEQDGVEYYYGSTEVLAKLPDFVGITLHTNQMEVTKVYGPFVFYNHFEDTLMARKISRIAHTLYPTNQESLYVQQILEKYALWVDLIPDEVKRMETLKTDATRQWTNVERVRIRNS